MTSLSEPDNFVRFGTLRGREKADVVERVVPKAGLGPHDKVPVILGGYASVVGLCPTFCPPSFTLRQLMCLVSSAISTKYPHCLAPTCAELQVTETHVNAVESGDGTALPF